MHHLTVSFAILDTSLVLHSLMRQNQGCIPEVKGTSISYFQKVKEMAREVKREQLQCRLDPMLLAELSHMITHKGKLHHFPCHFPWQFELSCGNLRLPASYFY